jgi:tRNA-(ms[2]io[6]A)-hydroxylase
MSQNALFVASLTNYQRRKTNTVAIGDLMMGSDYPIRIQSMTTTDTMDTLGSVEQIIRMVDAGCELVRLTAPSMNEAENLANIKAELKKRNLPLGKQRKDVYVNKLLQFQKKDGGPNERFLDQMLIMALIEARSCERFRVLSEHIEDQELALFYRELMASEAGHHTMFLKLARKFGIPAGIDVDARWEEFLQFEASLIQRYEQSARIHG